MSEVSVVLPAYPFWPNEVIREDPSLLDALARDYHAAEGGGHLEMAPFLYGVLPVVAFERIFAGGADRPETGAVMFAFHLSGYFGGVWLRGEIDRAQPASQLAGVKLPPGEDAFRASTGRAAAALTAAAGSDHEVLEYNAGSLFPGGAGGGVTDGLVESFGYNQGYLLEILESPPEGLVTPKRFWIEPLGPLGCRYTSPKLNLPERLRNTASAIAMGRTTAYAELARRIEPIQAAGVAKGRGVWSSGLSVQGFPAREYEQLLDVSSSFLEDVQATALATAGAVAEQDPELGRPAAIANAAMDVWLSGYSAGLLEGRDPSSVPRFERPDGAGTP